ncbi:MAG: DUF4013 domain-containing protein [Opitutales bacterium]
MMKETPIFEEVFARLLRTPGFWLKLLVGGLLSFIPVVNFLVFGYLLRLSQGVKRTGRVSLPEWEDWSGLFLDGLRFAVVWLVYWLLPVLLALAISSLVERVGLGALSYLLLSVVFLLAPILFAAALYRYTRRLDFKDLLDFPLIIRMSAGAFSRLIIPALVFVALFAVSGPLYGFAFFLAFILVVAQSALCFRAIEQSRREAL